jgi:protein SCO1/2
MRRPAFLFLLLLLPDIGAANPPDTRGLGFYERPGASLPDVTVADEHGAPVRLLTVGAGRPVVLDLGYFTCPSLCGIARHDALHALSQSGLRAGRDYGFVVLSIDPHEGAADAARAKARDLAEFPLPDAAAHWHYLTGAPAALSAVEQRVGFASRHDGVLRQYLHPTGLVVLDGSGRVSGYLTGVGYGAGELRAAVVRARRGGVEKLAQPVLLLCFHYDPATGHYSLAILKLLRLGAVLTALTLASMLLLLRRSERA